MGRYHTNSAGDWSLVAKDFLHTLPESSHATIVALSGTLGAGKTTFVQAIAKELSIVESVASPTFVLMKKYSIEHDRFRTLIHIDAYRFETEHDADVLRIEEYFNDPHVLIMVEWPEHMIRHIPAHAMLVTIAINGEGRDITISSYDHKTSS